MNTVITDRTEAARIWADWLVQCGSDPARDGNPTIFAKIESGEMVIVQGRLPWPQWAAEGTYGRRAGLA
jgi:hypothetical protein